jgi:hypothetical protein
MSRYKCIFCDNPVGSGEHVWPACLGGRRKNYKLLCATHNEKFSELDATLAEAFETINGLLGIVPDHSEDSEPKKATYEDKHTGRKYQVSCDKITLKDPILNKIADLPDGLKIAGIANKQVEVDNLIHKFRKNGFNVHSLSREIGHKYFYGNLHKEFCLWNPELCRAYGRIGLNFLAHFFPEYARRSELQPFKEFILGTRDNAFVKYESNKQFHPEQMETYLEFFHRIIISLNKNSGNAFASISFYGLFSVGIIFGTILPENNHSIYIDINPFALRPPDDWKINILEDANLYEPDNFSKRPIIDIDCKKDFKNRIGIFFRRLYLYNRQKFQGECKNLLIKIKSSNKGDSVDHLNQTKELLFPYKQRLLNHMCYGVQYLGKRALKSASPLLRFVIEELQKMIQPDLNDRSGLSQTTLACLDQIFLVYCEYIYSLSTVRLF